MAGSFTENFNKLIRNFLCGENQTLTDKDGTTRVMYTSAQTTDSGVIRNCPDTLCYLGTTYGTEGNLVVGITCGTSETEFNSNDYNCKTLIAHGDNDGQLHYMQSVVGAMSVSGAGVTTKQISRIVTNNGSVTVTVKEIALLAMIRASDGANYGMCIYREVLTSPVAILATQSATFRCTLTIPNMVTIE